MRFRGPYGEQVESFYGKIKETAVIEMAAAAGLPLAGERLNAGEATTYGVGELILDALQGTLWRAGGKFLWENKRNSSH